jgi:nitrogen-specific signal transduction histidine kinase
MNNQVNLRRLPTGKLNPGNGQDVFAMLFELQRPLDNINLSIEMFRTVILKGDQEIYLDVISRNITRIDILMSAFLIYAHPAKIAAPENSVRELLNEVFEIAGELISRKQIQIFREDSVSDIKIIQRKPAIKIALIHILSNAIDIMEQGEGKLYLKTEMINNKFTLRIEVNAQAAIGLVSPGLTTAVYLLRSNYISIVIQEEAGNTSYFMTFDHPPK